MIRTRVGLTALSLSTNIITFISYTQLLRHMGASAELDRLFYAASFPMAIAGVTSGVLLYILPTRFNLITPKAQESTLRVLFIIFSIICLIAILLITTYGQFKRELVLAILWAGFTLLALVQVLNTLQVCIAQARGIYLITGAAGMIYSVGLLAGSTTAVYTHTVLWILIGQLFGALVAAICLARFLGLKSSWNRNDLLIAKESLFPLKSHAFQIIAGTMAFTLFQPIDAVLCTMLSGGSISVMSYVQRVAVAVGTAVSFGSYTIASRTSHESLSNGGQYSLLRLANKEVRQIVILGLVAWASFALGGKIIFRDIFVSHDLSGRDLDRLVECLEWILLGVGPMSAIPYLFRVFYVKQNYFKPAIVGIAIPPVYGILALIMIPRFDILALAYAYSVVWWLALLTLLFWIND